MRDRIRRNIQGITRRIELAAQRAGRNPEDVTLIPVTKAVGESEARVLVDLGYAELGENRVEVAEPKIQALGEGVRWHMIGHVQRRKARDVARLFQRVDAVDRLELAEELDKRCGALNKTMDILIQINVSGEESKGGFAPQEAAAACERIRGMGHLRLEGLMTMAPAVDDVEQTRPLFAKLRELAASLELGELSMGMSNDFEVAVEEGATEVRIGTALFQ